MKTIEQLTRSAMTATLEPTTKEEVQPEYLQKFADWIGINTFGDPELIKVLKACVEWTTAFKHKLSPRWLSIIGESGTGKTHCADRLWRWASPQCDWSNSHYSERSYFWPDFVQSLRAGNAFDIRTDMGKWPLLFLDDIGAERDPSGFAAEELNTLLGRRVGKWTILTSNLTIDRLRSIDERITSRMIRGRNICVGVKAQDYATR